MKVGANAHPPKCPAQIVLDLGSEIARFPPWDEPEPGQYDWLDCNDWIDEVMAGGCDVLLVLDDVIHGLKTDLQSWTAFYRSIKRRYPRVTRFQIRNETDGLPGGASGPQPPDVLASNLRTARRGLGAGAIIYVAAMAGSGDPAGVEYLKLVDPRALAQADFVCANIYGSPPTNDWPIPATGFGSLEDTIPPYQQFGLQVAITEIGGEPGLFDDEHQRAEYFTRVLTELDALGVAEVDIYCITPAQCGDLAIVDENGDALESWAAIHDSAAVLA